MSKAVIIYAAFRVFLASSFLLQAVQSYGSWYRHIDRSSVIRKSAKMARAEAWLDYTTNSIGKEICETFSIDCILSSDSVEALMQSFDTNSMHQGTRKLFEKNNRITESTGKAVGAIVEISSVTGQNSALSLVGSVEWIALRCTGDWTMIPVENLIAACDNTGTRLAVFIDSVENLPGILFALELGPHAVILGPDVGLWQAYEALRRNISAKETSKDLGTTRDNVEVIQEATITGIRSGGVGDRVCLDLIQMLREGEGLLIGSSAKLLAMVHGETFEGDYVPSRPFRVNAGPVHSYVLMADGSTKYLSEVKAGDSVKVVDASDLGDKGIMSSLKGRAVTVGRCKIESRPMLMISYQNKDNINSDSNDLKPVGPNCTGQIFLQQAETVRLVCPAPGDIKDRGKKSFQAVSVTNIALGDAIFALRNEFGTHVGNRVTAKVLEL